MIARAAAGSFRDALGTLDQLVAFGGEKVALDDVLELLGAADAELLFGAVDAVARRGPEGGPARGRGDGALGPRPGPVRPRPPRPPAPAARHPDDRRGPRLLRRHRHRRPPARAQAAAVGAATLVRTIDELAGGADGGPRGRRGPLAVEVALLKAARPDLDPTAEGLLSRVERLEKRRGCGPRVLSRRGTLLAGVLDARDVRHPRQPPPPRTTRARGRSKTAEAVEAAPTTSEKPRPTVRGGPDLRKTPRLATGPGRRDARCPSRSCPSLARGTRPAAQVGPALAATVRGGAAGGPRRRAACGSASRPSATFNKRKAEAPDKRDQLVDALDSVTGRGWGRLCPARRRAGRAGGGSAEEPWITMRWSRD